MARCVQAAAALLLLGGLAMIPGARATDAAAPPSLSPRGYWYTQDHRGVIQIRPCGNNLCGYIEGISGFPPNGGVLRDVHGTPQCHLELLGNLKFHPDDGRWHGSVTNPEDGQTYDAEVWVPPDHTMRLRGYVGLPLLGVTQLWPPFAGTVARDCHYHPASG